MLTKISINMISTTFELINIWIIEKNIFKKINNILNLSKTDCSIILFISNCIIF